MRRTPSFDFFGSFGGFSSVLGGGAVWPKVASPYDGGKEEEEDAMAEVEDELPPNSDEATR